MKVDHHGKPSCGRCLSAWTIASTSEQTQYAEVVAVGLFVPLTRTFAAVVSGWCLYLLGNSSQMLRFDSNLGHSFEPVVRHTESVDLACSKTVEAGSLAQAETERWPKAAFVGHLLVSVCS